MKSQVPFYMFDGTNAGGEGSDWRNILYPPIARPVPGQTHEINAARLVVDQSLTLRDTYSRGVILWVRE